jgi:hypothetical protein
MNAERKIIPIRDYSQAQTHAEWVRDTKLRDIRETCARLRQRLAAKQAMLEGRVHRDFERGRLDR